MSIKLEHAASKFSTIKNKGLLAKLIFCGTLSIISVVKKEAPKTAAVMLATTNGIGALVVARASNIHQEIKPSPTNKLSIATEAASLLLYGIGAENEKLKKVAHLCAASAILLGLQETRSRIQQSIPEKPVATESWPRPIRDIVHEPIAS